jgi:hypothetical protein
MQVLLAQSMADTFQGLNVSQAKATFEGDRQRILADITSDMGDVLALNRQLKEAIVQSAVKVGGLVLPLSFHCGSTI